MSLEKTEMVLDLNQEALELLDNADANTSVVFQHPDVNEAPEDKSYHCECEFLMPKEMWIDFGKPEHITIAVRAGDTLNAVTVDTVH